MAKGRRDAVRDNRGQEDEAEEDQSSQRERGQQRGQQVMISPYLDFLFILFTLHLFIFHFLRLLSALGKDS